MPKDRAPGLAAAVTEVMKKIGTVEKSGENKFHGYKYASEFDLLRAVQPAMAEQGLMLVPIRSELTRVDGPSTKGGKPQWITHGTMTYELRHVGGESVQIQAPGSGIDGEDKGPYKAATGALKYALRQAFLIPTGDDPDQGREPEQDATQARRWVVRQHYAKPPEDSGYNPQALEARLKDLDLPGLEDVRWFCIWLGRPMPSQMDEDQISALLTWLGEPEKGGKKFDDFVREVGL